MAQLPITNVITISVAAGNPGVGAYNTSNLALFTDDAPLGPTTTISFSGIAASGNLVIIVGGNSTSSLAWNATTQAIQIAINALSGASHINVSGTINTTAGLTLTQPGVYGALPAITFGT